MQPRTIQTDGLAQQVLEAGEGPLVILCHGFPELAYSWRHQLPVLAAAGYRAVAPDMRGYGGSERPQDVEAYSILHLTGDMVDLVRALGEEQAVIIGHDWGAPVAWHAALLRPDVFRAVGGLSIPFQPRRPGRPPLAALKAIGDRAGVESYMVGFQRPEAEAMFERDVEAGLRAAFWAYDGATPDERRATGFYPKGQTFLSAVKGPAANPPWMTDQDLAAYVAAFSASGFGGPINWYRNLDRNHALTAFAQDRRIEVPAMFLVGEKDPVRNYTGAAEQTLADWVPDLRLNRVVPGAGHWLQQERPDEVSAALLEFLGGL